MADATTSQDFQELLDAIEPRTPIFWMGVENDEYSDVEVYNRTVRCVVIDSLTCDEIGSWEVDPISALHLLHKASFLCIDGERDAEEADFTVLLYAMCNAWFHKRCEPAPAPTVVSDLNIARAIEALQVGDLGCALGWINAAHQRNIEMLRKVTIDIEG